MDPIYHIRHRPPRSLIPALRILVGLFAELMSTKSIRDQRSAKKVYQRDSVLTTVYNFFEGSKQQKILVVF